MESPNRREEEFFRFFHHPIFFPVTRRNRLASPCASRSRYRAPSTSPCRTTALISNGAHWGDGEGGGAAPAGRRIEIRMRGEEAGGREVLHPFQTTLFSSPPRGLFQSWKQLFSAPNGRATARSVRLGGRERSRQDTNAAKKRGKHSKKTKRISLPSFNFPHLHSPPKKNSVSRASSSLFPTIFQDKKKRNLSLSGARARALTPLHSPASH